MSAAWLLPIWRSLRFSNYLQRLLNTESPRSRTCYCMLRLDELRILLYVADGLHCTVGLVWTCVILYCEYGRRHAVGSVFLNWLLIAVRFRHFLPSYVGLSHLEAAYDWTHVYLQRYSWTRREVSGFHGNQTCSLIADCHGNLGQEFLDVEYLRVCVGRGLYLLLFTPLLDRIGSTGWYPLCF